MTSAIDKIESCYNAAVDVAIAEMQRLAIAVLEENKRLNGFCNGMGVWSFSDKQGHPVQLESVNNSGSISEMMDFYNTWDEYLKITGHPLRIERVRGKLLIENDW